MGDRPGTSSRGAHEWGQSAQKRHVLVYEGILCPKKLTDVSVPGLGEAGRYSCWSVQMLDFLAVFAPWVYFMIVDARMCV